LRAITNSQVAEFQRRAGRQPVADGGSEAMQRLMNAPADVDDASSNADRLNAQVQRLEKLFEQVEGETVPLTWQAFWLSTVEDKTSTEVANELGMSPNAVRLAKARVLRRLRELAGEGGQTPTND
jgi:RNA polymerase sigma-70 factor (ECF subfamily)